MKKSLLLVVTLIVVMTMVLAACAPAAVATEAPMVEEEAPVATEAAAEEPVAAANPGLQMDTAVVAPQFFNDADYETSLAQMSLAPLNPEAPIYLQYLVENGTDISKYPEYADFAAKEAPYNICFSNAGVNNPWRVVGYVSMREQVEALRAEGMVKNFYHLDAQGNDAK
ncbi:MAG: hypothetical protein FP831_10485, partial [Anaerolineae bacterium]|nr:hypothetical protein [Anaerolineae bacterium]